MKIQKLVICSLILCFILAGCSSPTATPSISPEQQPEETEAVTGGDETVSQEPVTLRFWSWRLNVDPGFDEIFAKAKAEFEASHPGVKIEANAEPYDGYVNKMTSVLAAGNPPEIIHVPASNLHQYLREGWFEPLDKYLAESNAIEGFGPAQNWCKVGDQYYCVLLEAYGYAALVNEEIFAEAGVEWPTGPITAVEFTELSKKLILDRDGDGVTDVYGMAISSSQELAFFLRATLFLFANGVNYQDETGKFNVTRPEIIDALTALKDAYDSGAIPVGMNHNDTRRLFHEEKAAYFIDGTWAMDQAIKANPALADKVKVYPLPFPMIIGSTSNLLALPTGGEHNDLAWDFIELWTKQEYQEMYAEKLGLPLKSGVVTEELKAAKPWMIVYEEALKNSTNYIPPGYETVFGEFRDMVINRYQEILIQDRPVEEALQDLQDDLDKLQP